MKIRFAAIISLCVLSCMPAVGVMAFVEANITSETEITDVKDKKSCEAFLPNLYKVNLSLDGQVAKDYGYRDCLCIAKMLNIVEQETQFQNREISAVLWNISVSRIYQNAHPLKGRKQIKKNTKIFSSLFDSESEALKVAKSLLHNQEKYALQVCNADDVS